jgi:NAD(P)-dependent dehydrogenase (short-subunit alcohol dehydrogenase family)
MAGHGADEPHRRLSRLPGLGRPEEIAWGVIVVAADRANFITGETLDVSGGPKTASHED